MNQLKSQVEETELEKDEALRQQSDSQVDLDRGLFADSHHFITALMTCFSSVASFAHADEAAQQAAESEKRLAEDSVAQKQSTLDEVNGAVTKSKADYASEFDAVNAAKTALEMSQSALAELQDTQATEENAHCTKEMGLGLR